MSGYYDDNDDYDQEPSGPKALRDQLDKLKKDLKAATDALEAERTEKAELSKQVKSTTLRNVLSDNGIDPKHASRAERDGVEATDESVKRWIEENKDVYVFLNAKPAPQESVDGDEEDGPEDEVDSELIQQILAGQNLEQVGRASGSTKIVDALEGIDVTKVESRDDLLKTVRALGVPLD